MKLSEKNNNEPVQQLAGYRDEMEVYAMCVG